ncbi:MAG: PLDc N-terminal domain-containing protein [Acidimicrobiales bacterium]
MVLAAEWGTGQVFWSFFWFALFVLWIALLIKVFADILRDDTISGWGKALWLFFLIVLPILTVLFYLFSRSSSPNTMSSDYDMVRTH